MREQQVRRLISSTPFPRMYLYRIHREIIARNPIEHGCKNGYEHALCAEVRIKFSFPEPVVSWPGGIETRGSGSSRYRMSENFGHPVTHMQMLQISMLMLITDFCPSPLHWGKNFSFPSSLQRVASLGCFENAPLHSTWIH